jgi:hypothetical protein
MTERRIVQISVVPESEGLHAALIAVADDGTVWRSTYRDIIDPAIGNSWYRLPPLPPCGVEASPE